MRIIIRSGIAVAGLLVSTGAIPAQPEKVSADFCARLAADSGIDKPASPDGRTKWTASAMNFGQRVLLGGSAATGVGVKPIEPATVAEYKRLDDMCTVKGKGAICRLVGPVTFKFNWKGREILIPMAAGERATVEVIGYKTSCRTEAAQ
ncbi:hypothetical protein [uncultured Sphingomonas sp.]|uniref:hypothetical protein n=1 Tax=uncultured Sphingomonas sp. TaxID=158754 RepID=UPI0025E8CE3B|nr:hypothetical protein [uncultured Sphingomonas sp.]